MALRTETITYRGTEIELTYFQNPMKHVDWHAAEELGLVYSHYIHNGPDYWDDDIAFCKPEYEKLVEKWDTEYNW